MTGEEETRLFQEFIKKMIEKYGTKLTTLEFWAKCNEELDNIWGT